MRADLRFLAAVSLTAALSLGGATAYADEVPDPESTASTEVPEPGPAPAPEPEHTETPADEPVPEPTAASLPADRSAAADDEPTPEPEDTTTVAVDDAQLRWNLNTLLHMRPHFGANFLIAGAMPDTGGDTMPQSRWKQREGAVRIERASGSSYVPATWDGFGTGVDHQVVVDGGTGTVDATQGAAHIRWTGAFGVARYSGMTAFSVSDPELVVEDGVGRLTATLSGYGASRDGGGSGPLTPTTVVLADLPRVDLTRTGGFSTVPAFHGVRVSHPDQRTDAQGRWGSFPASFVSFVDQVGQAPFWMTSGSDDDVKAGGPVLVSWSAADPVTATPPPQAGGTAKPVITNRTSTAPAPFQQPTLGGLAPASALPRTRTAPAAATTAAFVHPTAASLSGLSPVLVDPEQGSSQLGWWIAATFLLMSATAVAAPSLLVRPSRS